MDNYAGYKKLVSKVLEVPEEDVFPLQDSDLVTIEQAVSTIGHRYWHVLERRFGLSGEERQTLRTIAKVFGVSPERIRQLEAQALTKLRNPSRIKSFKIFTKAGLEKQERVEETPLLERKIEDFELSTRTRNALNASGEYTIGELTHKTEREMLMSLPNFGRKSLTELKNLLQSFGLDFAQP